MKLNQACITILKQLAEVISQVKPTDFSHPIKTLSNSTIGQHIRHTLEFFVCLEKGCEEGIINYDKRSHDKIIETDKFLALSTIERIIEFIESTSMDNKLTLQVSYDTDHLDNFESLKTTYSRELVYNIEHAVHHMALIKIGVMEATPYVNLPDNFGIAASTVRYKESLANS